MKVTATPHTLYPLSSLSLLYVLFPDCHWLAIISKCQTKKTSNNENFYEMNFNEKNNENENFFS